MRSVECGLLSPYTSVSLTRSDKEVHTLADAPLNLHILLSESRYSENGPTNESP